MILRGMSVKCLAVVGCGDWGKNLLRNFHELGALAAYCDLDYSRLKSFQEKYPEARAYPDYHSLLQDSQVKAIAIATSARTHYELARKALRAGKDVMVEKPLALCYDEARELVSLAEGQNQILMVGHVLLYHPAIAKLKAIVGSGELGKVNYIYSNRLNLGKFRVEENILWSFAPHDISVILYLLKDMPDSVQASGAGFINPPVVDVTVTNMNFPNGVRAHIFVSWLHPYKEQKLVVIGEEKMALFDDLSPKSKLFVYDHKIDWTNGLPIPRPEAARPIEIETEEPLRLECGHFLDCVGARKAPLTDGEEGLRVLRVLEACERSLREGGRLIKLFANDGKKFLVHETARIDEPCEIGAGTKIWHFTHILRDCRIGKSCVIGQNVSIGPRVIIGDNAKIQNNVSVYEGVTLENDVFCGPSMVFTNIINPRSHWPRKDEFRKTLVKKGASLGANSTILCGLTIGKYAFVGAGAVVNKDVPDYALVYGVPARVKGWMCYCGQKLRLGDSAESRETTACASCGRKYKKDGLLVSEV
jgi:UDP-2-acetamido-3-amino-2,3-dideoxy-glucuronate N-acetyltransferase